MQQLLILGNGFDLACGLNSTYKAFFDHILKQKKQKQLLVRHIRDFIK